MDPVPQVIRNHIDHVRARGLRELSLSNIGLEEVPAEVFELDQLRLLDLSRNNLRELPAAITRLRNLTALDLSGNYLDSLPKSITQLRKLSYLDLRGNQLRSLPESITRLTNLTDLYLARNQLRSLPESIAQLRNLSALFISSNQLRNLPESITTLNKLMMLDLNENNLDTLPESITALTNLIALGLSGNRLRTVPSILPLKKLETLFLEGNPLEEPPIEVVEQGLEAIRGYFRQREQVGVDYLAEARLLILGEGGAGKTTLMKKLADAGYQLCEEDSTRGIEVLVWSFPREDGTPFRVNIWDFGGQEIYHATHQFFLSKRSLYLLVADTRKEDTDFYYWLNVVELLSENSPLLIVKNEKQDRQRELNERQLRGEFTNLKETLAVNLATNRGLPELLQTVRHYLGTLPHIGSPLPKTWVAVRQRLEADERNHISLDEYLAICEQQGFRRLEDKLQLSGYLHDLGVCLHFQQDPLLKKTVILKPSWGTDAVYKVLDSKRVVNNLGRFTREDLAEIWDAPEYALMHDELLQLMINFKLCYVLPGGQAYIAPQLLSDNQPEYAWDEADNLLLRYSYEFMPKGILTQFIVAMHPWIIDQSSVWKSGVLLAKDDTRAEVIENYGRREIRVRISGKHKRDLMTIVLHELEQIHAAYNRLKYDMLIPCHCPTCAQSPEPYFFRLATLKQFTAARQQTIQCQQGYAAVSVRSLIDDVIDSSELKKADAASSDSRRSLQVFGDYIDIGGGTYVAGDVDTERDFVGRDQGLGASSGPSLDAATNPFVLPANLTRQLGAIPGADQAAQAELEELIKELWQALRATPDELCDEAEVVAECATELVKAAARAQPNKTRLRIKAEGLREAAAELDAVPGLLRTASRISEIIQGLLGS